MIYGIANGDIIINTMVVDDLETARAVVGPDVELVPDAGMDWVRTANGWAAPAYPPVKRKLSSLEFEFHVQEAAGLSDDDILATVDDPNLRLFWMRLTRAQEIDPDHPIVAQGLDSLVALGHLTDTQRQAVLDSWPVQ